jgi:outer membrane lipoprotein-sorting protein
MQQTLFNFKPLFFMAITLCAPLRGGAPSAASAPVLRPSELKSPPQSVRPFVPLTPAERDALLVRFKKESGSITAIRSKFTQTSQTAMLVKPEVSTGTLTFKKPLAFRYEYDNGNVFTLDKGTFTYYLKAQKQAGKMDVRRYENMMGKYADPLGILDRIGTDYQLLEAGLRDDRYRLKLAPGAANQRAKRGPLASLTLELTGTPLAITAIAVEMKNGDTLGLEFEGAELNPVLPDGVFSVKIPLGVVPKESLPSNLNF